MLVLVDLDGTVYTRSGLIDGAVAALAELRAAEEQFILDETAAVDETLAPADQTARLP